MEVEPETARQSTAENALNKNVRSKILNDTVRKVWKSNDSSTGYHFSFWALKRIVTNPNSTFVCPCHKVVLSSIWLLGFIIAAVPLMNEDVFGNYYGRNGVCFPLHSDKQEKPTAKVYSTGIFLGKLKKE